MICNSENKECMNFDKKTERCCAAPGSCIYQPRIEHPQVFSSHYGGQNLIADLEAAAYEAGKQHRFVFVCEKIRNGEW